MNCLILLSTTGFISSRCFYSPIQRRYSLRLTRPPPLRLFISLCSVLESWDRVSKRSRRMEDLIFSISERFLPANQVGSVGVFPANLCGFVGALPEHLLHDVYFLIWSILERCSHFLSHLGLEMLISFPSCITHRQIPSCPLVYKEGRVCMRKLGLQREINTCYKWPCQRIRLTFISHHGNREYQCVWVDGINKRLNCQSTEVAKRGV